MPVIGGKKRRSVRDLLRVDDNVRNRGIAAIGGTKLSGSKGSTPVVPMTGFRRLCRIRRAEHPLSTTASIRSRRLLAKSRAAPATLRQPIAVIADALRDICAPSFGASASGGSLVRRSRLAMCLMRLAIRKTAHQLGNKILPSV